MGFSRTPTTSTTPTTLRTAATTFRLIGADAPTTTTACLAWPPTGVRGLELTAASRRIFRALAAAVRIKPDNATSPSQGPVPGSPHV